MENQTQNEVETLQKVSLSGLYMGSGLKFTSNPRIPYSFVGYLSQLIGGLLPTKP